MQSDCHGMQAAKPDMQKVAYSYADSKQEYDLQCTM